MRRQAQVDMEDFTGWIRGRFQEYLNTLRECCRVARHLVELNQFDETIPGIEVARRLELGRWRELGTRSCHQARVLLEPLGAHDHLYGRIRFAQARLMATKPGIKPDSEDGGGGGGGGGGEGGYRFCSSGPSRDSAPNELPTSDSLIQSITSVVYDSIYARESAASVTNWFEGVRADFQTFGVRVSMILYRPTSIAPPAAAAAAAAPVPIVPPPPPPAATPSPPVQTPDVSQMYLPSIRPDMSPIDVLKQTNEHFQKTFGRPLCDYVPRDSAAGLGQWSLKPVPPGHTGIVCIRTGKLIIVPEGEADGLIRDHFTSRAERGFSFPADPSQSPEDVAAAQAAWPGALPEGFSVGEPKGPITHVTRTIIPSRTPSSPIEPEGPATKTDVPPSSPAPLESVALAVPLEAPPATGEPCPPPRIDPGTQKDETHSREQRLEE